MQYLSSHLNRLLLSWMMFAPGMLFSQQSIPANPDAFHAEREWQSVVDSLVQNLFDDYSLSWEEVDQRLAEIEEETCARFGPISSSRAFLQHKRGVIDFRLRNYSKAIRHYEEALRIREKINPLIEEDLTTEIIRGYNNIGGCLLSLNQPYEAQDYLLKGLSLAASLPPESGDEELTQRLHILAAKSYSAIGDLDNALTYYERVPDISAAADSEKNARALQRNTARSMIEAGGILANRLNRMEEAVASLQQALGILDTYPNPTLLADAHHNLGIAYQNLNRLEMAKEAYLQSAAINESRKSWYGLALNYNNLGVVFKKLGALDQAETYLEKAKTLFVDSLNMQAPLSLVYDNLGDIACLHGNLQEGLRYDYEAVKILVPSFREKSSPLMPAFAKEDLFDKEGLLISLQSIAGTLAEMHTAPGRLSQALTTFETADQLIDLMRSEYRPEASKASLVDKCKPIYEQAIQVCWRLYRATGDPAFAEKAFHFSEKSRAIILLEAVRRLKASFELPPELARSEQELNLKKNYYEKQYALAQQNKDGGEKEKAALRKALLEHRRQHHEILSRIEEQYLDYYNLKFDAAVIDVTALRRQLHDDQALLEYFVGDTTVFVFLIRSDELHFQKIPKSFPLERWVKDLRRQVQEGRQDFYETGYQIYRHLLFPIEAKLPERVIIVPDGMLGYVAFDMLPRHQPEMDNFYYRPFRDYLLHRHQISYQYSATLAGESGRRTGKTSHFFLGIAPAFEQPFTLAETTFGALRWNIPAVRQVANLFGGTALTGKAVSKAAFLEQVPRHRIIQLATHALANDANGELSFILFGSEEEDILHAKDLYSLRLSADLVVLSACQGGTGELRQGEGIISLARGFFYAGCTSVVPTLWSVDDAATNDLVTAFYRHLKQGADKDEALRLAKLQYLESLSPEEDHKAHPYYWAAFIPVGEMHPITKDSPFGRGPLMLLGIAALGLGIWLMYRRKAAW